MKIMTFNILSGREYPDIDKINLDFCGEVIKKYRPDFIGINEINNGGIYGEQIKELSKKTEYPYFFFGKAILIFGEHDYGNAFMSKYPVKDTETYIVPDPEIKDEDVYYETRGIIKTILPDGTRIFVTHMGLAKKERQNSVKLLLELIGENPQKTIVMGDFNMTEDDEDLKPLLAILKDTNKENHPTFPSDKPDIKIDYILTSPDIKVISANVIPEIGSDHRAYMIEVG